MTIAGTGAQPISGVVIGDKTYNASAFSGLTNEAKIQTAINAAVSDGADRVYIPGNMLLYDASLITFNTTVKMVCEGGDWSKYDVRAYGAVGDGISDDTVEIQAAINAAANLGGIVYINSGTYKLSSPLILKNAVILEGNGLRVTTLSQTGIGAVIKFDPSSASTIYGSNIKRMTLSGNLTDTNTGDGIYISTAFGTAHCYFEDLWITKCGRSGMYFSQLTNPWWNQYLVFKNVFIGDQITSANGCQSYAIYAEGGFSTNSFENVRVHLNKKGVKITVANNIIPEQNAFNSLNVNNIDNGNTVTHGVELVNVWGINFNNSYIEAIGVSDTSKVSAGISITGFNTRNVGIYNSLFAGFWNGIFVDQAEGVIINNNVYFWSGTTPASAPNGFINIGNSAGLYKTQIGRNELAAGSSAITYITGSKDRIIGFIDNTGATALAPKNTSFSVRQRPATLAAGNSNDYNFNSLHTQLITADAAGSVLTGFAGGAEGFHIRIINVSANSLTLAHQSASSISTNRIISPTGANVVLSLDDIATLEYDSTNSRWRIVSVLT